MPYYDVTGNLDYACKLSGDSRLWNPIFVIAAIFANMYSFFIRPNKLEHWATIDQGWYYVGHKPEGRNWRSGEIIYLHIDCLVGKILNYGTGRIFVKNRCCWCHMKVHQAILDVELLRNKLGPN